jgi:hypothetical protein
MYAGSITSNPVTPSVNMKNRLINSAMVIDQRNAGASVSTSSGSSVYTLDRWQAYYNATSKFTVQQNAGSVTPPAGFTNYLGITSTSAYTVGAAEEFSINQNIEGFNFSDLNWGSANAKTITLSFWVRSSLTGTFGGAIRNYAGNRSYPYSYTISSANTWEQKSVTIAGDTSGTWVGASANGAVIVGFGLGVGSSNSNTAGAWVAGNFQSVTGAVSVVGTNGATFYITGVQLEVGSTATSFDYRPYTTELQLCQRYFWQLGGSNDGNLSYSFSQPGNQPSGGGGMPILFPNPVAMRTSPDCSFNLTSGNYTTGTVSGTAWQLIAPNIDICSFSGSTVQLFGNASRTMCGMQLLYANISRQPAIIVFGSTAWMRVSAEL